MAVLEKTDRPQDAYSYLLLSGKGDAALQQLLNDAGAKGFRLVSRDIAPDWKVGLPRPVSVWMEKEPGSSRKFEFAVINFGLKAGLKASLNPKLWADFNALDYVKNDVKDAESRGFRLVRIISAAALIMEKVAGTQGESSLTPVGSRPAVQLSAYRTLPNLRGAKLQRKLQEMTSGGFCIADIDLLAPDAMWPATLLNKVASGSPEVDVERCDYQVIQKRDLGEDDFNQAGAHGFRLVAQSLNFCSAVQTQQRGRARPQVNAIFEKSGATSHSYRYRNLAAPELSGLSGQLEQAGAEGYHVVKLDQANDGGILVIMQKSGELTSK